MPALLVWYFLKLRRRPVRVSSSFLWKSAAADLEVNVPFRWLRPTWLLLLQLLVLACLVAAIARPAIPGGVSGGDKVVIVLDRSASMSAQDGVVDGRTTTRLDEAKARALDSIDRLGGGSEAMVVGFAAQAEALTGFTRDRGQLRLAIEAARATDQPGDIDAALELVANATTRGGDEAEGASAPTVLLFSDGAFERQGGSPSVGLGRAAFEFVRVGPPQGEAGGAAEAGLAPRPGRASPANIGIVALAARRSYEDPSRVTVFFRVQSTFESEVETSATVRLDGDAVGVLPIKLAGAKLGEVSEASERFELKDVESGVVRVSLSRPDILLTDNSGAVVVPAGGAASVLLVQPNVSAEVVDNLAADALESLGLRSFERVTSGEFERRLAGGGDLADVDLIVLDRVRPSVLPANPTLSFGATVPIPGLGVTRPDEGDAAGSETSIVFWQRSHPVLRYVGLGSVRVTKPLGVTLPSNEGARGEASVKSEVLASGEAGPLIVLVERSGVRRLVVGFALEDSQWWRDVGFPIFIKNAVDYLTGSGEDSASRSVTTAQPVSLTPLADADRVVIDGPLRLERAREEGGWSGAVSVGPLLLAGVYEVQGVVERDRVLAANLLDPWESRAATTDRVTLAGKSVVSSGASFSGLREIWRWFVLTAGVLLAFEWALYAWRMRV